MVARKKTVKEKQTSETAHVKEVCNDVKCPVHGKLRLHGRVFEGIVVSDKMQRTVVVQWDHQAYTHKYERYYSVRSKVSARNPACMGAKQGNKVRIAECRPLAKTVNFVVVEVLK